MPFINLIYSTQTVDMVNVPDGHYAILVARDGKDLPADRVAAPEWIATEAPKMLDAEYFLTHGGYRGP
ncbi:hypothetical protein TI05_18305, partial [Achromatium sp. WMS3]